jgi:hypothetical protein
MQTFSVDQLVGRTLGEDQIERLLGHGRLGAAYMAQQRSQGRTVPRPERLCAQRKARKIA